MIEELKRLYDEKERRSPKGNKYAALGAALEELVAARFKPGDRFFSEAQIIDTLQLSRVTVRKGLESLAARGVIERHRARGSFVKNVEGLGRVVNVGVFSFDLALHLDSAYFPAYEAMKKACRDLGFEHEYYNLDSKHLDSYDRLGETLNQLDAVIVVAEGQRFLRELLGRRSIPLVVLDHHGELAEGVDAVCCDNRKAVQLALEHLAAAGHRDIAFVSRHVNYPGWRERLEFFKEDMAKMSVVIPAKRIQVDEGAPLEAKLERLLSRGGRPTAIFHACANDAVKTMDILAAKGLRVPGDISLIAIDDIPLRIGTGADHGQDTNGPNGRDGGRAYQKPTRSPPAGTSPARSNSSPRS